MIKKLANALLLFAFTALLVSACSAPDTDVQKEPEESAYEQLTGYSFKIVSPDTEGAPFGYIAGTALADEVVARLALIGERHDCTAEINYQLTEDASVTALTNAAAASMNIAEAAYIGSWAARPAAQAGVFNPIDDYSEYLDSTDYDKWGNLNVQEMMMVKGVRYGLCPSEWAENLVACNYFIAANMALVNDFGASDPREAVEQNTWDRTMLETMVSTCNDKTLATPVYGMAAATKHIIRASLLANGCDMLVEENGELVSGWKTAAAVEALTWAKAFVTDNIQSFYNADKGYIANLDSTDWGFTTPFTNGESTLLLTSAKTIIKSVAYKVEDFAVLPWPVGPNGTPGQSGGYYENADFAMITSTSDVPEYSAMLLNELFEPLDSAPDKEAVLDYYRNSVFYDDRDLDVILEYSNYATYCYWPDGGDDMLTAMATYFFSKSPTELIESNSSLISKVITEQIMPNYLAKQELQKNAG